MTFSVDYKVITYGSTAFSPEPKHQETYKNILSQYFHLWYCSSVVLNIVYVWIQNIIQNENRQKCNTQKHHSDVSNFIFCQYFAKKTNTDRRIAKREARQQCTNNLKISVYRITSCEGWFLYVFLCVKRCLISVLITPEHNGGVMLKGIWQSD